MPAIVLDGGTTTGIGATRSPRKAVVAIYN